MVTWPRGYTTTLVDVAANQRLTVVAPAPGDFDGDGAIGVADLVHLILAWGPADNADAIAADLNLDGNVDVEDLVALITSWG